MRDAPPVQVVCVPDVRWRLFERAVWCVAAATAGSWVGRRLGWDTGQVMVAIVLAWVAVATVQRWQRRDGAARLEWTGRRWRLDGTEAHPSVRIDFGNWLLLAVDDRPGPRRWLAIDLAGCATSAHLLRAALAARQGSSAAVAGAVAHDV